MCPEGGQHLWQTPCHMCAMWYMSVGAPRADTPVLSQSAHSCDVVPVKGVAADVTMDLVVHKTDHGPVSFGVVVALCCSYKLGKVAVVFKSDK